MKPPPKKKGLSFNSLLFQKSYISFQGGCCLQLLSPTWSSKSTAFMLETSTSISQSLWLIEFGGWLKDQCPRNLFGKVFVQIRIHVWLIFTCIYRKIQLNVGKYTIIYHTWMLWRWKLGTLKRLTFATWCSNIPISSQGPRARPQLQPRGSANG